MRELSAAATLDLWEAARRLRPVERALALAARRSARSRTSSRGCRSGVATRGCSRCTRRSRAALEATAACPACGEQAEFAVDVGRAARARDEAAAPVAPLEVGGSRRRVAAAGQPRRRGRGGGGRRAAAERVLLERCVARRWRGDGRLPRARARSPRRWPRPTRSPRCSSTSRVPRAASAFVADVDVGAVRLGRGSRARAGAAARGRRARARVRLDRGRGARARRARAARRTSSSRERRARERLPVARSRRARSAGAPRAAARGRRPLPGGDVEPSRSSSPRRRRRRSRPRARDCRRHPPCASKPRRRRRVEPPGRARPRASAACDREPPSRAASSRAERRASRVPQRPPRVPEAPRSARVRRRSAAPTSRPPSPCRPVVARRRPARRRAAPRARADRPPTVARDEPPVRVHIGRLEVRANLRAAAAEAAAGASRREPEGCRSPTTSAAGARMSQPLAIGAVSAVLRNLLDNGLVDVGAPLGPVKVTAVAPDTIKLDEPDAPPSLNLFLYRTSRNQGWAEVGLPSFDGNGSRLSNPPLALNLHYLLTAYGSADFQAEILLGYAMHLLHERPVLDRAAIRQRARPEPARRVDPAAGVPGAHRVRPRRPGRRGHDHATSRWTPRRCRGSGRRSRRTTGRPAPYVVSVVLIEARKPTRKALPVLSRGRSTRRPARIAASSSSRACCRRTRRSCASIPPDDAARGAARRDRARSRATTSTAPSAVVRFAHRLLDDAERGRRSARAPTRPGST